MGSLKVVPFSSNGNNSMLNEIKIKIMGALFSHKNKVIVSAW